MSECKHENLTVVNEEGSRYVCFECNSRLTTYDLLCFREKTIQSQQSEIDRLKEEWAEAVTERNIIARELKKQQEQQQQALNGFEEYIFKRDGLDPEEEPSDEAKDRYPWFFHDSDSCVHGISFSDSCKWCCPEDDDGLID
jgi:hypothetical protein